jgi:hypothetical protein
VAAPEAPKPFAERHYTVAELAEMWKFSKEFVRRLVAQEPVVTDWVTQEPVRRRYRVLRIPESVVERLYNRAMARADDGRSRARTRRRPL